jgi:arsenate reductase
MEKHRVLFLCTGNSARSQMAEAFLRKYGGEVFEPHSAGLEPKGLNPLTVKVMQEAGIDISGHKSKSVDAYLGMLEFQDLITVCDDADKNCPAYWPGVQRRMHWSFEDPAKVEGTEEEKLARFREVRDRIETKVREWVAEES